MRAWILVVVLTLWTGASGASQGEHQLSLKGAYVTYGQPGGSGALEYSYHVTDAFCFVSELAGAGGATNGRTWLSAGIGLQLDAIQWIPYLHVTAGMHFGEGEPANGTSALGVAGAVAVEGGVNYRPSRRMAFGFWSAYHVIVAEGSARDMPSIAAFGIKASLFF
jgi:hypothetical protein